MSGSSPIGEELFKELLAGDRRRSLTLTQFLESMIVDDATGIPLKVQEFQKSFIEALQAKKIDQVLCLLPRSHGKTTILKAFISFVLGADPNKRVMIVSATEDQAIIIARAVEGILRSLPFIEIYGRLVPARRSEKWTDTHKYLLRSRTTMKDPSILAVGVESSIVVGKRADVIVVDDCVDVNKSSSETYRQKLRNYFWTDLYPTLEPSGKLCVVGTRYHVGDLYGELINLWQKDKRSFVQVLQTSPEAPLWPERYNKRKLFQILQNQGSNIFASQYKNDPIDVSTARLPRSALKFVPNPPREDMTFVIGIDPSTSAKAAADYFASCVLGMTPNRAYIFDIKRVKGTITDKVAALKSLEEEYNPSLMVVETSGTQAATKHYLEEKLSTPIIGRNVLVDKVWRMDKMLPLFQSSKVVLVGREEPDGSVDTTLGIKAFIDEWIAFPKGLHDDTLDAVEHALSQYHSDQAGDILDIEMSSQPVALVPDQKAEKALGYWKDKELKKEVVHESDLEVVVGQSEKKYRRSWFGQR